MIRRIIGLLLLATVIYIVWQWIHEEPSHTRDWREDHSQLASINVTDESATIYNVRNWSYATSGEASDTSWMIANVSLSSLEQVYFLLEPFGSVPGIAHTMLEFRFTDGQSYVVSIEARREDGEEYRPLLGAVLPKYEYLYVWTTARDMYANTHFWAQDELYRYPLTLTEHERRVLFQAMIADTNDVATSPRWYNTFKANCTNVLAKAVNKVAPDTLRKDLSWVLPGLSVEYLYQNGYIKPDTTLEQMKSEALLNPHIEEAYSAENPVEFNQRIDASLQDAQIQTN